MTDLTKWPRLVVTGKPVTEAQADEILLRTDGDWHGRSCNLRDWTAVQQRVAQTYGWPKPPPYELEGDARMKAWRKWNTERAAWEKRWGVLELSYLANWRISSQWFGGAHGWCDWTGAIGCATWNIGKWPSEEEVLADWQLIAAAFPYLELRAQLWPEEGNEPPAVEYRVANGDVLMLHDVTDPIEPKDPWADRAAAMRTVLGHRLIEQGCSEERLDLAFRRVQEKMTEEGK